jgi:cell division protein FtsQ
MRSVKGAHDPAPSRLNYRLQRWWLTPSIRSGLRIGIPLTLAVGGLAVLLGDAERRAALQQGWSDLRSGIEQRPEFMVSAVQIAGAGEGLSEEIRATLALALPVSSLRLDLEDLRSRIAALDPVLEAGVRIRPGGVLQIDVTERAPVLIWRNQHGLFLLDGTGTLIGQLDRRADRGDLPLIAGHGANAHVDEALALLAAAGPLSDRLRGLVRIGERRWDLVLDRDQRILLPVEAPVQALERVIALSEAQEVLERDVLAIDLRLAERPTLRMTEVAVQDWWRLRQINQDRQTE